MTIITLPKNDKWKIVASSFIISPRSAVKELIDNSIDGGAKAIYIDVDSKTGGCEYICVRDDGTGVSVEDRESMCLNNTTSKIESMKDLETLASFGFRGAALFLLSTLANKKGSLEVITRCDNENIGEKWLTDSTGMVRGTSRTKISIPVGTSIIIKDLMGGLRVRKIELMANARKTIDNIKCLATHYAINNRNIRFIFSLVTLSKNGSVNSKQIQLSLSSDFSRVRLFSSMNKLRKSIHINFLNEENHRVNKDLTIDYILPTMLPDSDVINVKKSFKFLSVNKRPLSLQLGLGRQVQKIISSIYQKYSLLDPLTWYIDICYPTKMIDFNIEPEKNDVIISNIDIVLKDLEIELTNVLKNSLGIENTTSLDIHSEFDVIVQNNKDHSTKNSIYTSNRSNAPLANNKKERANMNEEEEDNSTTLLNETKSMSSALRENDSDSLNDLEKNVSISPILSSDTNWQHNYLSDIPISSEKVSTGELNIPSSLTYKYQEPSNSTNEDIELSMNNSVSNPFTITKMRSIKNTQKKDHYENKHDDNTDNKHKANIFMTNTPFDAFVKKRRKIDTSSKGGDNFNVLTAEKSNVIVEKNKTDIVHKNAPKFGKRLLLRMFSEYTNSFNTKCIYTGKNCNPEKIDIEWDKGNDDSWLPRDEKIFVSSNLLNVIEVEVGKFLDKKATVNRDNKKKDTEKELDLFESDLGWYVVSIRDRKRE